MLQIVIKIDRLEIHFKRLIFRKLYLQNIFHRRNNLHQQKILEINNKKQAFFEKNKINK
jgi:hypothetical protein